MLLPAVFHENLFDDWFDPFFESMDRGMNRETRNTLGHRETFAGTCARSFYVGDQVKKEDIHAKFEDGVLKITLPRAEARKELPKANPNLIDIE